MHQAPHHFAPGPHQISIEPFWPRKYADEIYRAVYYRLFVPPSAHTQHAMKIHLPNTAPSFKQCLSHLQNLRPRTLASGAWRRLVEGSEQRAAFKLHSMRRRTDPQYVLNVCLWRLAFELFEGMATLTELLIGQGLAHSTFCGHRGSLLMLSSFFTRTLVYLSPAFLLSCFLPSGCT